LRPAWDTRSIEVAFRNRRRRVCHVTQTQQLEGGYTVLEQPSREAALEWAAKFAVACRCAQEVRAFQYDPAS
jgi:hypothetical protein